MILLTKRRINLYLMINSVNTITQLFKKTGYSQALVNKYIKEYYDLGLISKTRSGRQVILEYTEKGIKVYKYIKEFSEVIKK